MAKSVWKSKSFIAGIVSVVTGIAMGFGIDIPAGTVEGIISIIGVILMGKSVAKRMPKKE